MSVLLAFFGVNPAAATRFLVLLVGTAIAIAAASAAGFGAGWKVNGWRLGTKVAELETRLVAAVDQGKVLAAAVNACSAGVEAAHQAGDAAVQLGQKLIAEARRLNAGAQAQAKRMDELLAQPTPAGADCRRAWEEWERNRMAGAAR